MDPFSLILAIAPLLTKAAKTIKACSDVQERYRSTPTTLALVITKCHRITHVLSELQLMVLQNLPHLDADRSADVCDYIDSIVVDSTNALSAIEQRIEPLRQSSDVAVRGPMRFLSRRAKAHFIWNEDEIESLLQRLYSYQRNLAIALQLLQVQSGTAMREMTEMQSTVLAAIAAEVLQWHNRQRPSTLDISAQPPRFNIVSSVMSDTFEFDSGALKTRIERESSKHRNRHDASPETSMAGEYASEMNVRSLAIRERTIMGTSPPRINENEHGELLDASKQEALKDKSREDILRDADATIDFVDSLQLELARIDNIKIRRDALMIVEAPDQDIPALSKSLSDGRETTTVTSYPERKLPTTTLRPIAREIVNSVDQEAGPKLQLVESPAIERKNSNIGGTIKCVVIGDTPHVKTTMIISYTTNKYPSEYIPTVSGDYSVSVIIGDKKWNLWLWDTAWQKDYDRLRPLCYPQTDVFIVCAEIGRKAQYESALNKWAPELRHHCPGVPYILVGVRCPDKDHNESPFQIKPDEKYGRMIAEKMGARMYLQCDVLSQWGLKDVFREAIVAALEPPPKKNKQRPWRRRQSKRRSQMDVAVERAES